MVAIEYLFALLLISKGITSNIRVYLSGHTFCCKLHSNVITIWQPHICPISSPRGKYTPSRCSLIPSMCVTCGFLIVPMLRCVLIFSLCLLYLNCSRGLPPLSFASTSWLLGFVSYTLVVEVPLRHAAQLSALKSFKLLKCCTLIYAPLCRMMVVEL